MRTENDQWDITTSVGLTALAVAAGRACETDHSDPLVVDPFAATFVRRAGATQYLPLTRAEAAAGEMAEIWQNMTGYMGVRSKFFDDFFLDCRSTGIQQAVILASGLDTRAYRLDMPQQTFEIDQPQVLEFKEQVLTEQGVQPHNRRAAVRIDLRRDWGTALQQAGFDAARPTAWLAEGLMPYLPTQAQQELFAQVHRLSAPGSRIAIEAFSDVTERVSDHPLIRQMAETSGMDIASLWFDEPDVDPVTWFSEHGWTPAMVTAAACAQSYGRPLPLATQEMFGHSGFLVAGKNTVPAAATEQDLAVNAG